MRAILLSFLLLLPAGCHRCPAPPSCTPDLASPDLSVPDLASPLDLSPADLASPPDACLACNAIINPCNALGLYCYRGCCSADPH